MILTLTDGTTSYDLLSDPYRAQVVNFGNPARLTNVASNIHRGTGDLVAQGFGRRTIRLMLRVTSADLATLQTDFNNLQAAIRLAALFQTTGLGNRWQLKVNIGGSAKNVFFNVQSGRLDLPAAAFSAPFFTTSNPNILQAPMLLECDALGQGDAETVENYVADPSFEVAGTALADWTENITATGTTARSTAGAKYGNAQLLLTMTNSGGSGEVVERTQVRAEVDGGETWSFGAWINLSALSNSKAVLKALYNDGGATESTVERTTTSSGYVQIKLEDEEVPAGATQVTLKLTLEATAASATGTLAFDGIMAIEAASIPTTWVGGRAIVNHFDDDGQAHLNYLDIEDVPGDYPAKLQLKAAENEAHTNFWAGARHGARQYDGGIWHEGEDFDTWGIEPSGAGSGAAFGRKRFGVAFDAASSGSDTTSATITVNHTVTAGIGDRLVVVAASMEHSADPGAPTATYDGNAMTHIPAASGSLDHGGRRLRVDFFYYIAPDAGAADAVVTYSVAVDNIVCGVVSFSGVDQTTPTGGGDTATGNGNIATVTVTTVADDFVIGAFASGAAAAGAAPTAPLTERWDIDIAAALAGAGGTDQATGTSKQIQWSGIAVDDWIIGGVAIKPITATASSPFVVTKAVASPPRGTYRVLARAQNLDAANFKLGIGYTYGGVTQDPTVTANYADIPTGTTAFHILDIGAIQIPPEPLPDNATLGTFTLRLAMYRAAASATGASDRLDVDSVILLPVDFGSAFVNKASGQDVVVSDSLSKPPGLELWDTSDVFQSRPQQEGSPPLADPEGTRVYMVSDDGDADIDDGWTVGIVVTPQFITI